MSKYKCCMCFEECDSNIKHECSEEKLRELNSVCADTSEAVQPSEQVEPIGYTFFRSCLRKINLFAGNDTYTGNIYSQSTIDQFIEEKCALQFKVDGDALVIDRLLGRIESLIKEVKLVVKERDLTYKSEKSLYAQRDSLKSRLSEAVVVLEELYRRDNFEHPTDSCNCNCCIIRNCLAFLSKTEKES